MKPILHALLLADRIYEDKSGKKIICGTFNQFPVEKKAAGPTPMIYISLTEVIDGTELLFQMTNISKNQEIFHSKLKLNVKDRLATIEIILTLPPMGQFLQEPATLSFDILYQGEIVGSRRLMVKDKPKPLFEGIR
jgi:hypothetical protein